MPTTCSKKLLFLSLFLLWMTLSKSEYLSSSCEKYNIDSESQYQTNLKILLTNFSSKAKAFPPGGFYNASVGSGTNDTVYGLFLCRGDQNATGCGNCVTTAAVSDLPNTYCPQAKEAVIWYDQCMLRYSNVSFFGVSDTQPMGYLVGSATPVGDKTVYTNAMYNAMRSMVSETATNTSGMKFTTKVVNVTSSIFLYALQQCTPDLKSDDCTRCLRNAIDQLALYGSSLTLLPSCNVRYESYPFYIGAVDYSVGSKGGVTTFKIVNNCNYTIWPSIVDTTNPTISYGFPLKNRASKVIDLPRQIKQGRIIGRTECSTNARTGTFSCLSGDCGSGDLNCHGKLSTSAVTLILFTFGNVSTHQDFYDVSVVYGYNLPVAMAPEGDTASECATTGCVFNLNDGCPDEFRVVKNDGTIIGCKSPCEVVKNHKACCTHSSGCHHPLGSLIFKNTCPRAHRYPLDDTAATFNCSGSRVSYTVTFCPPPSLASSVSQPFSGIGSPSPSPSNSNSKRKGLISLIVGLTTSAAISILMLYGVWICVRKKKVVKASSCKYSAEVFDIKKATLDILQFDLHAIQTATQNFAADNKLGEGGFGEVYKGILENGQEIAVKRLSDNSRQGNAEFKNEVALVAKLRHKNLVTLLGFCVSSEEKILVYEFLHKSSLDKFLNDQTLRQTSLNWQTRFKIIVGIARGILYLHEDSPLKVIHRDLKSSNILLDDDMNPKIADFGLAKLFGVDQTQGDTKRIVGTYGYMAPEYAITGHYSVKSDVYSFGVIILELVSGQMNRFYRRIQLEEALLHRAWRLWNKGESLDLVDTTLNEEFSREEASKCIHIGLLCIQEDATLRPRMTSIVAVLNGQANNFPMPKPPNFFGINVDDNDIQHNSDGIYRGSITITDLYLRD